MTAEIRGHRRTYIGSMPRQDHPVDAQGEVVEPAVLLDEVDKMGADSARPVLRAARGARPEQNHTFNDHYWRSTTISPT